MGYSGLITHQVIPKVQAHKMELVSNLFDNFRFCSKSVCVCGGGGGGSWEEV